MAWNGYFEYDGTEILNIDRTVTYVKNHGMHWLKCDGNANLGLMLGETYASPVIDDAPWMDPDRPESNDFFGTYPLSVVGLEDSTIEAAVTESVLDGGVVNRPRRATRPIVYSLALLGANERGVEYGVRWLKTALSGAACKGLVDCTGANLCYLSSEPVLDPYGNADVESCMDPLLRTLHKVTITTGPNVTSKFTLPSGGEAWTVSFTAVAGDPYEFMIERPLIEDFLATDDFYVSPYPDHSDHVWSETIGIETTEFNCNPAEYRPLYDPNCPMVIPPPGVPSVQVSCFNFPETFNRRFFTIPEEEIPLWGTAVPIITLRTGQVEERNIRLRFYADVMGTGDPEQDPCAYCGDIVVSWIPAGSTMVLDGTKRQVIVQTPGQPLRRADSVVFKSDGTPFEWPELTCGFSYLAVVDTPLPTPAVVSPMARKTFEDGLTTGWANVSGGTFASSTERAATGEFSLKVTTPTGFGGHGAEFGGAWLNDTANTRYRVSAWVYIADDAATLNTVQLYVNGGGGGTVSNVVDEMTTGRGEWQRVTHSFDMDIAGGGLFNIKALTVGGSTAGDRFWIDDINVERVTTATPNLRMNMSLVNKVL